MTPSPALLQNLSRSRLRVMGVTGSVGVGDRRSKSKGAGLEFTDHRNYAPGDDLRHLDLHLHARLGEHYIRQYSVYQQLPITILIDASASMNIGEASKFVFACRLAGALAFVGLAGGDLVQIGVYSDNRLKWSQRVTGTSRASILFEWLTDQHTGGAGFERAFGEAVPRLLPNGLLIAISDWWTEELDQGLAAIAAVGQELLAVHVTSREEEDPRLLGDGEIRLVDAEDGGEIELTFDPNALEHYQQALAAWQERLRRRVMRSGRYLQARSDADLDSLLQRDWRRAGVIG